MSNTKIIQVVCALILHYNCLITGLIFGWPSSMMILFKSEESPLNRPMTDSEISLLGSMPTIGGLVGAPLAGMFLDKLGRKKLVLVLAFIAFSFWLLIIFTSRVEFMLVAVFVSGLIGGIFLIVPVYISEFAEESIRGTLAGGTSVFSGFGILISYLFGGIFSYRTELYLCLIMSFVGMLLIFALKESPTSLMKKRNVEEARKSLRFYRNCQPDSEIVHQEIEKIRRALLPKGNENTASEEISLRSVDNGKQSPDMLSAWKFFKKSKSTQRAFIVCLIVTMLSIGQGMMVTQIFSKLIFSTTVPAEVLSATWCCVILSLISVVFGMLGAYLSDFAGRRTMMIFTSIATGVCSLVFGTQLHLRWGPDWLTILLVFLYNSVYSPGPATLPFVLMAEFFLPDVKSILTLIVFMCFLTTNFIIVSIYYPVVSLIGLGPIYYIFSTISFLTAIFCYIFLPETKGLYVDAIQHLFVKPNRNGMI